MNNVMNCCAEQITSETTICRRCDYEWNHIEQTPPSCKSEDQITMKVRNPDNMNGFKPMAKTEIKPGSLVIINESDRPCTRLIVFVDRIFNGYVEGRYICQDTMDGVVGGPVENVVAITDFGVDLTIKPGLNLTGAVKVDKSRVLYSSKDKIRDWQPIGGGELQRLKPGMYQTLIKSLISNN